MRDCRVIQEEKRLMSQKLAEIQSESEDLRRRADGKHDDQDQVERELKKLQEKHRETIALVHNLQTARDHLEATVRVTHDEMNRLTSEHEEKANLWRKEQASLNHRVSELIAASERQRLERDKGLDKYREKATTYKQKLRLALQNVQTLA